MPSIDRAWRCLFIVVALALPACGRTTANMSATVRKVELPNAAAIAKCLPAGVSLDSITTDLQGTEGTVAEELARLKATVKEKTLYDGRGREIRFYTPTEEGRAMRGEPKYVELRAKYTVVLLFPE